MQHVHRDDGRTTRTGRADQRTNQGGSDPLALPRIGHDDAELDDCAAAGADPLRGDPVPDDLAVPARHNSVGITTACQDSQHCRAYGERAEEPQIPGSRGQAGKEVPDRFPIRHACPPDRDLAAGDESLALSPVHEPSFSPRAESVN